MAKKEQSRLRKAADRTLLTPVNMVFNSGTKANTRLYAQALKSKSKIYCPKCTQGVLISASDDLAHSQDGSASIDSNGGSWVCTHCDLTIKTQTKDRKELIEILKQNSHVWYQQGIDEGYDDLSEAQRAHGVKTYQRKALFFYFMALLALMAFPYFALNSTLLPTINMLLLFVFLSLSGLAQSYKAFKLYNDLLYFHNPKLLFKDWIKSGRYFKPWSYAESKQSGHEVDL